MCMVAGERRNAIEGVGAKNEMVTKKRWIDNTESLLLCRS